MEEILAYKEQEKMSFDQAAYLFDNVVTNAYLKALEDCEIVSWDEKNKLSEIRWYQITKIIIEKDVFFPDKLSMLYNALHKNAKEVVLALDKNGGKIELYIGARDFEGIACISGDILKAGFQGYFPGVGLENKHKPYFDRKIDERMPDDEAREIVKNGWTKVKDEVLKTLFTPEEIAKIKDNKDRISVSSVSVLASLRDDKKESFTQGIEKLINASSSIPRFTAFFIAENVSDETAIDMIQAFNTLQTSMSPLCEVQTTTSESHTKSISESLTKGFSESVTKNLSITVTHSKGKSDNYSPLTRTNTWNFFVFSTSGQKPKKNKKEGKKSNEENDKKELHQHGEVSNDSTGIAGGLAKGQVISDQQTTGFTQGNTKGFSIQITQKNSQIKRYNDLIDKQVERLQNGIPFGLWSVATYFIAPIKDTALKLANIYKGCIVGENSSLSVGAINCWEGNKVNGIMDYLDNKTHPKFDFEGVVVTPGTIVTSEELAIHLSLPQSSVPGILVREEQSFGRSVISENAEQKENDSIEIGSIMHLGEVSNERVPLYINNLSKHAFVTGTTGSGKSNTLYCLISKLMDKRKKCLVIEPAKGEYKYRFGWKEGVSVYGSNPKQTKLLRINPFEFPEGIDVYQHIDSLVEVFNACWPMYAAMPQVLSHSIIEAYKNCGWDMERSFNPKKYYPSVEDVLDCLKEYINSSNYSSDTKGDYIGSLETRLQSLCDGTVGRMFRGAAISNEELFNENVIIDLSQVKSMENQSLIMGLLVLKLDEFRSSERKGMNQPLRHVTVLEEAHHLLKRTSTTQNAESSNVTGMAVEKIANSMAEMRTYGEGFIIADQSPSMLDLTTIRNTNTKIIMALPEKDDRETAGKSIGLDDKHVEEISRLKTGEAIVYQSGWEEAVKTKIDEYKDKNEKPWNYSPSELFIDYPKESLKEACYLLLDCYTTYNAEINHQALLDLLVSAEIPIGRYNKTKEKLDLMKSVNPEDIAYIFATIVGVDIFESAKRISDTSLFNARISRALSLKLGIPNDDRINGFVNMYMKGCEREASVPFYEGWLQSTLKNK